MKSLGLKPLLVTCVLAWAPPSLAAPEIAHDGPVRWHGRNYCWSDTGWNGAGWYRCGQERKTGHGWGGPEGWEGASNGPSNGPGNGPGNGPSSGAWFESMPPTPPVSAPGIAHERDVAPLRGGAAAGSPATPLRR